MGDWLLIFSTVDFSWHPPQLEYEVIVFFVHPFYNFNRSPDEPGPVYSIEQPEERESSEPSGKKLDKEMKPGPVKAEMVEPLSQYELSTYPSEFGSLSVYLFVKIKKILATLLLPFTLTTCAL